MYQGKHCKGKEKKKYGKIVVWTASLCAVLVLGVGGVLAFLSDAADAIGNRFAPASITTTVIETLDGAEKSDVKIKNTGDATAWIRAAVVVTWKDAQGNVYGQLPLVGTDYTIVYDLQNGWEQGEDGFYYWKSPVRPQGETGVLISRCVAGNSAPDGYALSVEILGSGLQNRPADVFEENWESSGFCVNGDVLERKGGVGR